MVPLSPTAQPEVAESIATERSERVVGEVLVDQLVPFHLVMTPLEPTAQPMGMAPSGASAFGASKPVSVDAA